MKIQLIVVQGKPEGKVIPMTVPVFRIGRGPNCHLRPNSEQVSREHAEIAVDNDQVTLRDLGSRNGSLLNGKSLSGVSPLKNGDVVQIGPLTFAVSIQGAPAGGVAEPVRPGELQRGRHLLARGGRRASHPRKPFGHLRGRHHDLASLQRRGRRRFQTPFDTPGESCARQAPFDARREGRSGSDSRSGSGRRIGACSCCRSGSGRRIGSYSCCRSGSGRRIGSYSCCRIGACSDRRLGTGRESRAFDQLALG